MAFGIAPRFSTATPDIVFRAARRVENSRIGQPRCADRTGQVERSGCNGARGMTKKLYYMVAKDLLSECRALRTWPAMLLLGAVVALMFAMQMDLLPEKQRQIIGSLLWLTIFFAGTLALDRSFAAEREDGCWEGLFSYPV